MVQIDERKPNRPQIEGDDIKVGDLMVTDENSTIYGAIAREGQEERATPAKVAEVSANQGF